MKQLQLLVFLLSVSPSIYSQSCQLAGNFCMDGGEYYLCEGTLFDPGGDGNAVQDGTVAIYPGQPESKVSLNITFIDLFGEGSALLHIYDGEQTAEKLLLTLDEFSQPLQVSATPFNTSGSLILVLELSPDAVVPGFEAEISCITNCSVENSEISISNISSEEIQGFSLVCNPGSTQVEYLTESLPGGFTPVNYEWFIDGIFHSETSTNTILIDLSGKQGVDISAFVYDEDGCYSFAGITSLLTHPDPINLSLSTLDLCLGESGYFDLDTAHFANLLYSSNMNDQFTWIDDVVGFTHEISLEIDDPEFDGMTIAVCEDLFAASVSIAHSYAGDLDIQLVCPDGSRAVLTAWPNDLGGVALGLVPDETNFDTYQAFTYVFSMDGESNFSEAEFINVDGSYNTVDPTPFYIPDESFCELQGCPISGEWTFEITDYLGGDMGFVNGVSIFINDDENSVNIPIDIVSSSLINPNLEMSGSFSGMFDASSAYSTILEQTLTTSLGCDQLISRNVEIHQIPEDILINVPNEVLYSGIGQEVVVDVDQSACEEYLTTESLCYEANNSGNTQSYTYCSSDYSSCGGPLSLSVNTGYIGAGGVFNVYDGSSTSGELITSVSGQEDLSGMEFTFNVSCITIQIISNNDCDEGDNTPFNFDLNQRDQYIGVVWSPLEELQWQQGNNGFLPLLLENTTYYVESIFYEHGECAVYDSVQVIMPVAHLSGAIFFDANENGIQELGEDSLSYFPLIANQDIAQTISDENGIYSIGLEIGQNEINFIPNTDLWQVTTQASLVIEQVNSISPDPVSFGVVTTDDSRPEIDMAILYGTSICDLNNNAVISFSNSGNTILTGYFEVQFDEAFEIETLPEAADSMNGNTVYFSIDDLGYYQSGTFEIDLINPNFEFLDMWLESTITFYSEEAGQFVELDSFTDGFVMVCAYDPNAIYEHTGIDLFDAQVGCVPVNSRLEYTITFQNTGSAPAMNVLITDTLPSELDELSIIPGAKSHDYEMIIDENRVLSFFFENIMLPDSTSDLEGSQGFVSFSINQVPELEVNHTWSSEANIFFDQNPAVITEPVKNRIWDCDWVQDQFYVFTDWGIDVAGVSSILSPEVYWIEGIDGDIIANGPFLMEWYSATAILEIPELDCIVSEYHTPWSVDETVQKQTSIYPNPILKGDMLNFNADLRVLSVEVFDEKGKLLKSENLNANSGQFQMNDLSSGSYVVHFELVDGTKENHMLIIR